MMNEAQPGTSLLTVLLTLLGGGGLAALLGAIHHWRQRPQENRLITAQTEAVETDIIHKSVEAAVRTGEYTLRAMERAEAEIEHLTAHKQALEAEREALKATLRREMEELRRDVKGIDDRQADIFLIIGELRKAEKNEGEEN